MSKKILLSGVKPTGRPHIGNYFGAMKQFVDMQNEYECYFMLADYHALNFIQNGEEMKRGIIDLALDYLALGLDPQKSVIFKQSDVSEHTELTWIFDSITTMPYLMLSHAFKANMSNLPIEKNEDYLDEIDEGKGFTAYGEMLESLVKKLYSKISVGTFNYPMLMASDILMYDTDVVPVGQDQKQHIEYTRDTAQKFNHVFKKEVFKLPEPKILDDVAVVPGTDGQKMSKSYGNTIPLFATDEEIEKAVMSIVTDSGTDIPQNVYAIHRLLKTEEELKDLYEANKGKYKALKDALIVDMKAFIKPLRERREQLEADIEHVMEVLKEGGRKAKSKAEKKMDEVRDAVGVKLY